MSAEQFRANEFLSHNGRERLAPGQKLLLAGPGSLVAFAFTDKVGKEVRKKEFKEETMMSLFEEYCSIYELLVELVGKKNINVIKTSFIFGKNIPLGISLQRLNLPDELNFGSTEASFLSEFYRSWPRDAHTLLAGKILARNDAWSIQDKNMEYSGLAEGGKVLTRGKSVLVTPDIWKTSKGEILNWQKKGFKLGCLPFVDSTKQKYDFKEDHIDGHASLIEDKEGKLVLLVADSYSHQGQGARKLIDRAAQSVDARMFEVDDKNLPPLAFNLLQFEDRSVAVTGSEARDLEVTLSFLVGVNNVFTTDVPLGNIPALTAGGIRCFTNIIPSGIIP